MLEAAHPGALHHLDHFRRIALFPQPPGSGFSAVAGRDQNAALGRIGRCRIPRHPHHVVQETGVEFVFALHIRGQFRTSGIHPLLPPFAHQRSLQAIGAVHAAMEGIPLQAHARVMRERPAVAVEVFVRLVIVVLLDAHDDAVTDEGPHAAAVRVVGRTTPRKRGIIPVLVVIDPLPRPVRIFAEGVAHLDDRLQCRQRQDLISHRHRGHRPRGDF